MAHIVNSQNQLSFAQKHGILLALANYRKKSIRAARWAAAIVVAAVGGMGRFTIREMWFAAQSIWIAIWAEKHGDASRLLYFRRMRYCKRCPLYSKLGACGSPFNGRSELGCFCHMDIACKQKSHTCWLKVHTTSPGGWPAKLMRKSWTKH